MPDLPEGYHTITPRIFTADPDGLIAFLRQVFGVTGERHLDRPAEVRIGDSLILVSGTSPERAAFPAFLYVYLDDIEEAYARAIAGGARSLEMPRTTPYGDTRAMFEDRWGNTWQIASR